MTAEMGTPYGLYSGSGSGIFYSPFSLNIQPMKRLLLINLEKDPDEVYIGFEPQIFDDPIHGRGLLVIAYRRDKKVDVYHQPGLKPNPEDYQVTGKGLHRLVERSLDGAYFEAHPNGVHAAFSFDDALGRPVQVELREDMSRPRRTFPLLAPLGSSTENPQALPLYFLYDFGFVRRAGTYVSVEIAGRRHRLDGMPLPVAGEWVYFTRYTTDPLILNFIPNWEGELQPVADPPGEVMLDGVYYSLVDRDGHPEIQHLHVQHTNGEDRSHSIVCQFDPPFPNLPGLRDGAHQDGSFIIHGEEALGTVNGVYSLRRSGEKTHIRLHPSDGWQPNESRWSVRYIFNLVKIFRTWPSTYEWTAEIKPTSAGGLYQKSAWRRLG